VVLRRVWSISICLLAILSASGLAWGQVDNRFNGAPEKLFLQPYSPVNHKQNLDASYDPINHNANKYKDVGKASNNGMFPTTKKPFNSTLKKHKKSELPRAGQKIGAAGTSLGFQGYGQSSSTGSGSFLDGYLLRFLHGKGIGRKKVAEGDTSVESPLKKKKDLFIK
jgi:hypothetical protein